MAPTPLLAVGLFVIALHELAYRQTHDAEFPLFGLLSHAAADMLALLAVLALTAAVSPFRYPTRHRGRQMSKGASLYDEVALQEFPAGIYSEG